MLGTESRRSCSDRVDVWAVIVVSSGVDGRPKIHSASRWAGGRRASLANDERYYLTSNRRPADQAPATPEASLARTLHHMRAAGSELVENVEADTLWTTIGEVNVLWSSIWIV